MSGNTRKQYRFGNDLSGVEPSALTAEVSATEGLLAFLYNDVAEEGKSDPSFVTQMIRALFSKWSERPCPPSPITVCAVGIFLNVEAEDCERNGHAVLAKVYDQLWHEWVWWARACGTELVEFDESDYAIYDVVYPQVAEEGKSATDIVREALSARA